MISSANYTVDGSIRVVYDTGEVLFVPQDAGNRHYHELLEWTAIGNTIGPAPIDQLEAERIANIKAEASARILDRLPEWKQRNTLAGMLELVSKIVDISILTQAEQDAIAAAQAEWQRIKEIRRTSDEAEINGTDPDKIVWPV